MQRVFREVGGIACFFTAVIVALALFTFNVNDPGWSHTGISNEVSNSVGRAGAWFSDVAFYLFGYMAYLIPALLLAAGWMLFRDKRKRTTPAYQPYAFVRVLGIALMLLTASGLADLHFGVADGSLPRGTFGGGILGTEVAWRLVAFLHPLGTTLLLLALFFCSLTMAFGTSWIALIETMGGLVLQLMDYMNAAFKKISESWEEKSKIKAAAKARQARLKSTAGVNIGDPLLDGAEAEVPKTGLAAALAAARERAKQGTSAVKTVASSTAAKLDVGPADSDDVADRIDANFDAALRDSDDAESSAVAKAESPVKAALARAGVGKNKADDELPTLTQQAPAAPKKKIKIKPRLPEQKQTKLFLDVPSRVPCRL